MSDNLFALFRELTAGAPVQIGEVVSVSGSVCTVSVPGAGDVTASGSATVGDSVLVQAGVIIGPAPSGLVISTITV